MPNYDNIKPYADFAHEAAQHGGVASYLDEIAESNRKLGIQDERETEGRKAALLLVVGLAVWEGGKAGVKKIRALARKRNEEKKELLRAQSDEAKKSIIEGVSAAEKINNAEENDSGMCTDGGCTNDPVKEKGEL